MRSWSAVFWTLLFLLPALLAVRPQSAQALTASQVYEQVKDSVVVVKAYDRKGKQVGLGSGVMLPSGDIITNYHLFKAGGRYTVGRGKKAVPATLKSGDPDKDLCLLMAPGLTAEPARLGKAARLKVGEPVYAVGAPQGLELSLSEGIVSQLHGGPPPLIQTTAAISPGSSGGGLFNAEGELVGITTFYLKDSQSLNFALPVEWIAEVAGRKPRRLGERAPELPYQMAKLYTVQEMKEAAIKYADHYDIPRDMFLAYFGVASNWNPLAKDPKSGAMGLGQITDEAGKRLGLKITWGPDDERWDPGKSMDAIARLFVQRFEKYGNWKQALLSIGEPTEEYYNRVKERARQEISMLLGSRKHAPEAPAPGEGAPEDSEGHSRALYKFYKEKDWQALEAYCRRWTKAEPKNDVAWYSLGLAYEKMGRHREAVQAFREALRIKPDDAETCYNLGVAYGKMGHLREAVQAFREVVRIKPDLAEAWYNLGNAYGKMGRHRDAVEANREALRLKTDYAEAWYNLGVSYLKMAQYREAVEAFREALRIKPDLAEAWNNLAIAYAQSGNRSAALEAVRELRRYDPQQADKLFNLIMKP